MRATVISADGTSINYDRAGSGSPLVLLTGNLDDGAENEPLAQELAAGFTTYNLRRRGRAGSGNDRPYSLQREIEDIAAVIEAAGGMAHLYGVSSGGALALEAAAAGLNVDRVIVYEVPYSVGSEALEYWQAYVDDLEAALSAGRRGEAVELFMRLAGASDEDIAGARSAPVWAALEDLAPTLAHDAACLGDGAVPRDRLATVKRPTLVLTGTAHDPTAPGLPTEFFDLAADEITAALPNADRDRLPGQGHVANPQAIATAIRTFIP
ncbi:alpha/beta hydrolase [Kribbella sp. NPDC026611]|uniref:alpha/beta fold hydrolase n=1 Tax=Kribbella sp. NPDC026611 TaxID=3154911 RepID=UPI003410A5C8